MPGQFIPPPLPQQSEWRRSGPFLLLAIALHALLLATPLSRLLDAAAPPPLPLDVTLVKAPEPLPVASPPPPKPHPAPAAPAPVPPRERPQRQPPPVLALAAEPTPAVVPTIAAPAVVAAPPTPVAEAPSRPAPAAIAAPAISAARYDAAYLQNPKPSYPALSRRLGEEGKVLLKVRVGSDGRPLMVDLEKSSNFERLDNAARQVVQGWRFVPARRGDEAVEATVIVPIVFRLDS